MIDMTSITPSIGAELKGFPVSRAIDDRALAATIKQALLDHHVLVFRDQELDREQHKAFGRLFGRLHVHPSRKGSEARGDPEIFTVKADENTVRNNGGRWHMDVSCEEVPPLGSLLHLKEAPPAGGDTLFANMHLAYETLSKPIRTMLRGCAARHDGLQDLRWYGYEPDPGFEYPATTHPVVVLHPETGRPLLNVNEAFTSHIHELSQRESDAVLAMLFAHISQTPTLHRPPRSCAALISTADSPHRPGRSRELRPCSSDGALGSPVGNPIRDTSTAVPAHRRRQPDEAMRRLRVDVEVDGHAADVEAIGQIERIVKERVIVTDDDEHRGQIFQISERGEGG
jgi:taurine dioxygenase